MHWPSPAAQPLDAQQLDVAEVDSGGVQPGLRLQVPVESALGPLAALGSLAYDREVKGDMGEIWGRYGLRAGGEGRRGKEWMEREVGLLGLIMEGGRDKVGVVVFKI